MIEYIYSKIIPNKVLHVCINENWRVDQRQNITKDDEILQVSLIQLPDQKTFVAHRHLPTERKTEGTSESWVVISGKIEVFYYDLDNSLLCTRQIGAGGITITYEAGHNYLALEPSRVVEFKNGPYLGIEKDKVFI